MKKTLLLCMGALLLCGSAEARKWDFSKWSDATKANLEADASWTNDEKGNGTNFAGAYWYNSTTLDDEKNLVANGETIAEMAGLHFTAIGAKHAAIATDYQTTKDANAWGPYNGERYFWIANKALRITIPSVKPGTTIAIGEESHKPSDARGVDLYVNGTKIAWTSGQSTYPTGYSEYTWTLPEEFETTNEDGTVDVVVTPSNGCHLYFIDVQETQDLDAKAKVGYVYQGDITADVLYEQSIQNFDATAIDADNTEISQDSLLSFDVLVYASSLKADNKFAQSLVNYDNMIPVLNLSASLCEAWGWGTVGTATSAAMTIGSEDNYEHELFAEISSAGEGTITFFEGAEVATFTAAEGSFTANDEVLASNEGGERIQMHGNGRNEYIGVNFPAAITADNYSEDAVQFINNAIPYLQATKKKATNASKPTATQTQSDGVTTVALACTTSASQIYYAAGDAEFQAYAEPLQITADSTVVKAYAMAHGYFQSDTASFVISVMKQAAAPTLAADMQEGKTVITLSAAEGSTAYFNFAGLKVADGSKAYEESFEITEPGTITYFAGGDNLLLSEIQTYDIKVAGIPAVKDTVAHFTANQNDWVDNAVLSDSSSLSTSSGAIYYFGKSAWNYYSATEYDSIVTVKDSLGNVLKCIDGETDSTKTYFKADPATIKTVSSTADTQWMIKSHGQVITCESTLAVESGMGIDDGVGNEKKGRYAASIFDCLGGVASKGCVDFGGKTSGEPYSMEIASTVKFTAPFDIVTYLGNGSTGSPVIVAQTSTDGENWNTVDTLNYSTTQRYWRKTRMHVADAGEYYVRVAQVSGSSKAQLYDIYVITTEGTTGIEAINDNLNANHNDSIFDLQGRRVNAMVRGQLYVKNGKKMFVK